MELKCIKKSTCSVINVRIAPTVFFCPKKDFQICGFMKTETARSFIAVCGGATVVARQCKRDAITTPDCPHLHPSNYRKSRSTDDSCLRVLLGAFHTGVASARVMSALNFQMGWEMGNEKGKHVGK